MEDARQADKSGKNEENEGRGNKNRDGDRNERGGKDRNEPRKDGKNEGRGDNKAIIRGRDRGQRDKGDRGDRDRDNQDDNADDNDGGYFGQKAKERQAVKRAPNNNAKSDPWNTHNEEEQPDNRPKTAKPQGGGGKPGGYEYKARPQEERKQEYRTRNDDPRP